MKTFAGQVVREFTRARLSAPDDRIAVPELNGLGIRPPTSPGLVRRSGRMARGLLIQSSGSTLRNIQTRVGFLSPLQARIARVHELGTVGKGGRLPDIRPVRARRLVVPVRGLGAALGGRTGVVLLKRASIPPRLGYRAFVQRKGKRGDLEKAVKAEVDRMLRGGGR